MLNKWVTRYAKSITAFVAGAGAVITIAYGPDKSEHWIALVWALLGVFGVYQIPNHETPVRHDDIEREYTP